MDVLCCNVPLYYITPHSFVLTQIAQPLVCWCVYVEEAGEVPC